MTTYGFVKSYSERAFFLLAFSFLFVFFTQVHPLVIYDGDDWRYIAYTRQALPSWNEWNPSRVFAECFQPLMGYFAAYVLTPILGDCLHAQTAAVALLLSLMATAYLWLFYFNCCFILCSITLQLKATLLPAVPFSDSENAADGKSLSVLVGKCHLHL